MRPKGLMLISVMVILVSLSQASSQSTWDLSVLRVTLFPPDAEVQQGQPLLITIYIGNNELAQFSGTVTVSLYVDGFLASKENWQIGNLSLGSVPIPSGGYRTVVTSLSTSALTVGVHELTIEVSPKGYTDPRMSDNRYSLNFVVVPLVNPFIEVEGELVQGREYEVFVHVPNPRSEPLERVRVKLLINGSDEVKEVYVPPRSISAAKFYYEPKSPGTLQLEALLLKEDQLMSRASISVIVRPSCDLGVAGAQVGERVFAGEPLSGKLRVYNRGLSQTRANLTVALDGEVLEVKTLDFLDPGSEREVEFALGMEPLRVGSHVITARVDPLDAIDLDPANNDFSVSFKVIPVPISISARASGGEVDVNLTNLADVIANLEVSVLRNGSEIRRTNLVLGAGESESVRIRGLDPGNYTIVVYDRGAAVASTDVSVGGGFTFENISPLWSIAVIPIAGALIYYAIYVRRRRKKWPS
ncbi:MAG: CARDB domain-containing protein [Candidatus Korarchaeum sp.]